MFRLAADPSPLRLVIADDDATVRALLTEQLAACGHTVVAQAASGAEAVTCAAELHPDVVLLDVHMPDGSGCAAAELLVRGTPAPGIVLFTGDVDSVLTDAEIMSTGAVAVLPKPTPRSLLESTVRLAAARARDLAGARATASQAERQLAERKLIERAKGILMRRTGSTEAEAYRILQRSSQDRATPMVVLAQAVLDSEPGAARV
jgi:response regulator NasT